MIKNLFYNIGSKGIVMMTQFITLVITNHLIGPDGRGIFLAAITWSNTFFILSHCSIQNGILNLAHKDINYIARLAYISSIAAIILGILSIGTGLLLHGIMPDLFNNLTLTYLAITFVAIPFMMLQAYSMAIVQVKGNFRAFNFLYASYSILNLAAILVVFMFDRVTVDWLIYINLGSWVITGLLALYYTWPVIATSESYKSFLRLLMKTSLAAHFGVIVTFVINRSDILIINYYLNQTQTGIYGLAVGIVQILLILPLSVQNILYHTLLGKTPQEQKQVLLQYSRITFSAMFLCAILVLLFSRPLVYVIGGKSFEEAIPLFWYFLPAMVFYSVPMVLSTQWTIMGIFRQVNLASILILVISLVGNILLVPWLGITGGAVTFLTISVFSFIIHVMFAKKYLGDITLLQVILIEKRDIRLMLSIFKSFKK